MIWINDILQLQYYNQAPGIPCYCETILFPSDLYLQSPLWFNGSGSYDMVIQLMSADGVTVLEEDISDYCSIYFFTNPITGKHSFNVRLNSFSPAMCVHKCYVLHVVVGWNGTEYFNAYSERYCQVDCCDYARGISTTQSGLAITPDNDTPTTTTGSKTSECGDVYITLRTYMDCYDAQTGEYYATPDDILMGDASFTYQKVTNFQGVIQQVPREIERTYSLNCRLQKTQSQRLYELKSIKTAFPAWKMNEIENQLHAQYIYVEDERYEFNGGTAFDRIKIPGDCATYFRLVTTLNDCSIYQIFGCGDNCNTTGSSFAAFVVPESGDFYNEARTYIGNTAEEVYNYYSNLPNVQDLQIIDPNDYDCEFSFGFVIYYNGFVPNSFYAGGVMQSNRVYGMTESELEDVCTRIEVPCSSAEIGVITTSEQTCDTPSIGTITNESYTEIMVGVYPVNDWVDNGDTGAVLSNGVLRLSIDLSNTNYPYSGSPATLPGINEIIATIDEAGRPAVNINFSTDDYILVVTPEGNIIYQGYPTSATGTESEILIPAIIYNNG